MAPIEIVLFYILLIPGFLVLAGAVWTLSKAVKIISKILEDHFNKE